MKKLKLEDLNVVSFATSDPVPGQGTVAAHASGDTYCETEANRTSCNPDLCTDTGTGQSNFCVSVVECSADSCHPYTCSGSYDYTFCGCDTEYDYTCRTQC